MQIHSNAKTTVLIRAGFRNGNQSYRSIARTYKVSVSTVYKWRKRDEFTDLSSRPKNVRCGIGPEAECIALKLRKEGLTLDECLDGVRSAFPEVKRATLHRLFKKHGLGRLRVKKKEAVKKFKAYKPGYVHIDTFNLPRLDRKRRYCFLAVDRATRLFCLGVYSRRTKANAKDFLERAVAFFPFKLTHVLTDNGTEYTNSHYKGGTAKNKHPFDEFCELKGIEHRLTRIRTPKTNGMAERMVQMTKEKALRNVRYQTPEAMIQGLNDWTHRYNCTRKHGTIKAVPLAQAMKWYKLEPDLFTRSPDTLLQMFTTC